MKKLDVQGSEQGKIGLETTHLLATPLALGQHGAETGEAYRLVIKYHKKKRRLMAIQSQGDWSSTTYFYDTDYYCLVCGKQSVWQKDWDSEIGYSMYCGNCGSTWFAEPEKESVEKDHPYFEMWSEGERQKLIALSKRLPDKFKHLGFLQMCKHPAEGVK